jgi:hypothetical protein
MFQPWQGEAALRDLRDIVLTSDISPFEVNHSGLISALLQYLTAETVPELLNNNNDDESTVSEPEHANAVDTKPALGVNATPTREQKLRIFLHIFAACPVSICVYARLVCKFSENLKIRHAT